MFLNMLLLTISAAMMVSSHPVSILAGILAQTLTICVIMWTTLKTSWFSYILFLIFLGGLMVLFVYVVSLASNEKFDGSFKEMSTMATLMATLLLMSFSYYFSENISLKQENFFSHVEMMLSNPTLPLVILIMTYLLFALVVAVKISSKYEGPLRNTIK